MNKLKIAIVAPLVYPIGPPFKGGAQVVVYDLARGLAARGHDVTLFVAPGSDVPGVRLATVAVDPASLQAATFTAEGEQQGTLTDAFYRGSDAFRRVFMQIAASQPPFDILHAHAFDYPAYTLASFARVRRPIHTLHLPAVDPAINRSLRELQTDTAQFDPASRPALVTVSQRCAATYAESGVEIARIIYNGVAEDIPFQPQADTLGHLLFVGRIAPEKGAATAIRAAQATGRRLLMLGAIYDQQYYDTQIAPHIGGLIEHRGTVSRTEVYTEMGRAAALLFPIAWEEPFGLVAAESLAAGTPVLAYRRGALPEIVEHGRTGWLAAPDDEAALIAAVSRIGDLDRAACHAASRRFSLSAMLDAHERLYHELITWLIRRRR